MEKEGQKPLQAKEYCWEDPAGKVGQESSLLLFLRNNNIQCFKSLQKSSFASYGEGKVALNGLFAMFLVFSGQMGRLNATPRKIGVGPACHLSQFSSLRMGGPVRSPLLGNALSLPPPLSGMRLHDSQIPTLVLKIQSGLRVSRQPWNAGSDCSHTQSAFGWLKEGGMDLCPALHSESQCGF